MTKTQDASMYIQYIKRRAIQEANRTSTKAPKFIYWNKDSTNGSLETFALSNICPCIAGPCYYLYDAGSATANYLYIVNGNGGANEFTLDLGNATTTNCSS